MPKGKRGRLDLYIVNPDGSGAKRLTNSKVDFGAQPDWGTAQTRPAKMIDAVAQCRRAPNDELHHTDRALRCRS